MNKVRTFLFLAAALLTGWQAVAGNHVACVYSQDELQGRYELEERPVATFSANQLQLSVGDALLIQIPVSKAKVTFEEKGNSATAVEQVSEEAPRFAIVSGQVTATSLQPGERVSVLRADGAVVGTYVADAQGRAVVDLPESGVCIVRTAKSSFKVIKK